MTFFIPVLTVATHGPGDDDDDDDFEVKWFVTNQHMINSTPKI